MRAPDAGGVLLRSPRNKVTEGVCSPAPHKGHFIASSPPFAALLSGIHRPPKLSGPVQAVANHRPAYPVALRSSAPPALEGSHPGGPEHDRNSLDVPWSPLRGDEDPFQRGSMLLQESQQTFVGLDQASSATNPNVMRLLTCAGSHLPTVTPPIAFKERALDAVQC